jgi:SAM-dependent methyltransferase
MTEDRMFQIFLNIHSGLPRQGPGSDASTLKALGLLPQLSATPKVLDVGCGPGMQTIALAEALSKAHITAVDLFGQFLEELKSAAEAAGFGDRIETLQEDMQKLSFPPESFDLIWCEGAAYIMGVEKALKAWQRYLKPEGYVAFTDCVWLTEDPAQEAVEFWQEEYPAMLDVPGNLKLLDDAGYEVLGHFALPDEEWWTHYYSPLEGKLKKAREEYAEDEEGQAVIAMIRREIEMKRKHDDVYGYVFFIARPKA